MPIVDRGPSAGTHAPTELIDAVRGIAAAYVLLYHARWLLFIGAASVMALGLQGPVRLLTFALLPTRYGHAAVMAFFLVSGYAIHYRQAHRIAASPGSVIDWRQYVLNRARRLYPPLLAAILITFVLDTIGSQINPSFYSGAMQPDLLFGVTPLSIQGFIGTLIFVQGIALPMFGSNGPLWSLAYEGFFYAAYPLVLLLSRRVGPVYCLAAFGIAGLVAATTLRMGVDAGPLWLVAYWPAWVAGTFLADARAGRVGIPAGFWTTTALAGTTLLFGLALFFVVTAQSVSTSGWLDYLWVASFFGPLGWLAAKRHGVKTREVIAWAMKPFLGLGAISYSLYVVHFPIIVLLSAAWLAQHQALPQTPWLYLAGIVVSLVAAYAVHMVVERPLLARRRPMPSAKEVFDATGVPPYAPVMPPARAG